MPACIYLLNNRRRNEVEYMPSTFLGLSIASSGMAAYRAHFNVTAHNISNVKTPSYSKQWVEQKAKCPISLGTSFGMIGTGAEGISINSTRDEYYDYKFRKNNAMYGYYDTAEYYMKSLQDYLYAADHQSAGLSNSLNHFFDRLTVLTKSPADTTIRTEATGYADTLAEYANEMTRNYKQMQNDINQEINTVVNQINAYADQIASLTKQITSLEVFGEKANDLRDQRAKVIDDLSLLADVEVVEKPPADGNGIYQYMIYLGGGVLVDTNVYNQIELKPSESYVNQTDIDGLYTLSWSNGQKFDVRNTQLGGQLQALFEIRDGNNCENFKADFKGYDDAENTFTIVADPSSATSAANISKLNIPAADGVITVGVVDFKYDYFSASVAADGTYTYTFKLTNTLSDSEKSYLESTLAAAGDEGSVNASVGDSIAYRGIPYYLAQLNEFTRTLSATFNQQQNRGYDMYGNKGVDLFMATDQTSSKQLDMTEFLKSSKDGYYYLDCNKVFTQEAYSEYIDKTYSDTDLYEITEKETEDGEPLVIGNVTYSHMVVTNKEGKVVEELYVSNDDNGAIFTFNSLVQEGEKASYYNLTGSNFSANRDMVKDGRLIAGSARDPKGNTTGSVDGSGAEEAENLAILAGMQSDTSMFKQGDPISFLSVLTGTIGVDSKKMEDCAKNAQNITEAVDNRRLAVSGVDEDEEGQMIIEVQNLLNIQYKVVSVMNQVLDKLINEMGL